MKIKFHRINTGKESNRIYYERELHDRKSIHKFDDMEIYFIFPVQQWNYHWTLHQIFLHIIFIDTEKRLELTIDAIKETFGKASGGKKVYIKGSRTTQSTERRKSLFVMSFESVYSNLGVVAITLFCRPDVKLFLRVLFYIFMAWNNPTCVAVFTSDVLFTFPTNHRIKFTSQLKLVARSSAAARHHSWTTPIMK